MSICARAETTSLLALLGRVSWQRPQSTNYRTYLFSRVSKAVKPTFCKFTEVAAGEGEVAMRAVALATKVAQFVLGTNPFESRWAPLN